MKALQKSTARYSIILSKHFYRFVKFGDLGKFLLVDHDKSSCRACCKSGVCLWSMSTRYEFVRSFLR
nr:hypothetical protein [Tanacetum cinerariifolium]